MSDSTVQISCSISTTDPLALLGLEIHLDDQIVFDTVHVGETIKFTHDMSDADAEHSLTFVMKNKTDKDTTIDANGNIIKDACLVISDVEFDKIDLGQMFIDHAVYTHSFNGTQSETQTKFYGTMGCNGTVSLSFATPVYLWLLEHM
jgi:hypothetical protein